MSLFIVFILLAVLLGAGVMLAPAWRTAQPRIGLAATLCLALVTGGAVFYAEIFGWNTLGVDYLLFALLSGVVLGGTLSTAQARAEARGERLADRDQGWPGPEDLAFFALVALVVLIPLLHLPAALGTQGQINGFHSLATRLGASFNSLEPFAPAARVSIAPGFHALSAYLSQQLSLPIPLIQLSLAAVLVYLLVWLAYDLGAELRDKRLGRAMALATLLCSGIHRSYLDGHFSELLALLFLGAFLLYSLRLLRQFNWADLIAGGLLLGAVIYSSLSLSLIMLLAFVALNLLAGFERTPAISAKARWSLAIGLPFVALLGIAPWLLNNLPLLLPIVPAPASAAPSNLGGIINGLGIFILPLALWGMPLGLRSRGQLRFVSRFMLLWLLLALDFALVGFIGRLLGPLGAVSNAPNIARHGLILPSAWFGGIALLWLWETGLSAALKQRLRQFVYPLLAVAGILLLLPGMAFQPLLHALGPLLALPPATITQAEAAAMDWLRENAPADALLLAADDNGWLPVFAERPALDFRAVTYFEWRDLEQAAVERGAVDYVYVASLTSAPTDMQLRLVFEQAGARVYEVLEAE